MEGFGGLVDPAGVGVCVDAGDNLRGLCCSMTISIPFTLNEAGFTRFTFTVSGFTFPFLLLLLVL